MLINLLVEDIGNGTVQGDHIIGIDGQIVIEFGRGRCAGTD